MFVVLVLVFCFFFFFKQKTAYEMRISDWSSDVCSSDLASVGCALSSDLPTLLAFRALQGLSAGVGLIVGRALIRDVLHGDDAQRLMSQVSMIFGVAPAIAPIIG